MLQFLSSHYYPITHLHVGGSFGFLNFSLYASMNNESWVLIDSRVGDFEYHSNHDGWGLVPIPHVVDSSSKFVLSLVSGVAALVPLKIGDSNFRFKIGDASIDPGSSLDSEWSLSMWIRPESCRSPCFPIVLLTNVHNKTDGQGQSRVTLRIVSHFTRWSPSCVHIFIVLVDKFIVFDLLSVSFSNLSFNVFSICSHLLRVLWKFKV